MNDTTEFERKVNSLATVLSAFPPGQVSNAVQQLANDPDAKLSPEDLRVAAGNLSDEEQIERLLEWVGGEE